jgi:hypothetical protein
VRSRIETAVGWAIVGVGCLHVLATFRLRPQLDQAALWFLSGGLAIAYQGALNLVRVRYGRAAPGLRWLSAASNFAGLALAVAMTARTGGPQRLSWSQSVFLAVLLGAALLSLWPPSGNREVRP